MAIAETGGLLRDANGAVVVTTDTRGAAISGGFLCSPSGALVISG